MTRRLGSGCTEEDRARHTVQAEELLEALIQGRGVDLRGVVVTGELMLDQLPLVPVNRVKGRSPRLDALIRSEKLDRVRLIAGPLSIEEAVVRHVIATDLREGYLVMTGPVVLRGTRFDRSLDLSHVVFLDRVDLSDAVIGYEAFFIRSLFAREALFTETAFGTHTRFHKAVFAGPASFTRAEFNGLTEFLEVTFEQDARFSHTYYKMGSGFSGSRFGGLVDFSEAVFEREAFFSFAVFDGDALFGRATFRGYSDFSGTQFHGRDDFGKALFHAEPRFSGAQVSGEPASSGGFLAPSILYGTAAILLVSTVLFLWVLRRR